jgi:hypothetical protein
MRRTTFFVAVFAGLLWASFCSAAVFQRDWKTSGDGLLTYDNVNQREWLDLSQTQLSNQYPVADQEAKYQYVLSQTSAGGLFEGFTVAKSPDVIGLAQSAGINTSTLYYGLNGSATIALEQLLSITRTYSIGAAGGDVTESAGFLDEANLASRRLAIFGTVPLSTAGLSISTFIPGEYTPPPPGVMLYRIAVPEPESALLATVAILIMGMRRALHRK